MSSSSEPVIQIPESEDIGGDRIDFTDILLMLKIDGAWKCVAKAYNQNSDTIRSE